MNTFLSRLGAWAAEAKRDVIWGLKHPKTIRKAIVAAATHAGAMVTVFAVLFPQVSTVHEATFTAITTFLTGTVTFLTSNTVVEGTGGA